MTISAFSDELAQVGVRMPYSVINQAGKSSTRSIAVLRRWRSWAKAGSTQQKKRNARNPQSEQKESMYSVLLEAAALPKNVIPRAWKTTSQIQYHVCTGKSDSGCQPPSGGLGQARFQAKIRDYPQIIAWRLPKFWIWPLMRCRLLYRKFALFATIL